MRTLSARALGLLLPLAALVAGASCKGAPPPKAPEPPAPAPKQAAPAPPRAPSGPALLPSRVIAELDDENATPFFARRGKDGLVLFTAKGRLQAQVVGVDGDPTGIAPVDLGLAPPEVTLGALRPVGDGYVFAWAEPAEKNHALKVLSLDATGHARGPAVFAAQTPDDLSWIDVLPNAKGALLFWEVRHDERADLSVAPIVGGKPGSPVVVVKDALGWESIPTERGAVLATVMAAGPAPARKGKAAATAAADKDDGGARGKLGRVQLVELDDAGKAGAPIAVTTEPTAQIDVDVVELEGRYVVSWTDERDIDATVYLAAVDPGGKIAVAAHHATAPAGEQVLVALVAQAGAGAPTKGKRALFAWEDLLRAPGDGRLIHLATVNRDGQVGPDRATLAFASNGPPDLAVDGDGFAAMTLAPMSVGDADNEGANGKDAAVWPVYVRFGPDLSVLAAEPVRAAPFAANDGVPYLTRSLACFEGTCTTLASGAGPKAPLAFVSLEKRQSSWRAPAARDRDGDRPRATSVTAIYDGDHLADVSAAEVPGSGGNALAAWVTYYLDGTIGMATPKKGKRLAPAEDPFSATVAVRSVAPSGALGPINVLSRHGVSIGGVSIAPGPGGKRPEAAVAWVAKAKGEPQVFVTKLGANGERLEEKGVTVVRRKKKDKDGIGLPSECSDVAIAYAGGGDLNDGWIVAWVDTRDGNAEVYVAKVDRSLKKIVPDRRVTDAPGDASDVQIAVRGKETFLVWSDARNHPESGSGDIYLARFDTQTLHRVGEETRLYASDAHSRSPVLSATPSGLVAAWIEEPLDAAAKGKPADADAGVRLVELDDHGGLKSAPLLLRGDERSATTSVALTCGAKGCRGALTSAIGESLLLGGFQLAPGAAPGPVRTLATLQGGVTEDVSPIFATPAAEWLFFADDAVGGTGRLRWMTVAW